MEIHGSFNMIHDTIPTLIYFKLSYTASHTVSSFNFINFTKKNIKP